MTGIERTYYQAGMQARDEGLACCAPGDLSWRHRHWWMAGWNDRDIQRGGVRPDLQFKTFRGAYPYRTMTGEFTFDGAQYGGSVRDEGDGNLKWFIAQGDMAAWGYLEAERAAQQGEGVKDE